MIRALAAGLLIVVASFAQSPLDSLFALARDHYDNGRFEEAELGALRGLRAGAGMDELDLLKFHALLGFVYVAKDQNDAAREEFVRVLAVNPRYEPDPVTTSPKIVEVFREAKRDYLLRIASEPAVFRMPQADVRLSASWRSLVLPGWGQFYKEQDNKGAAIIAAQLLSVAALIYLQAETSRRHDDYLAIKNYNNPDIDDRYQEYRRAYQTRNTVAYFTLGIYALNYLDALYFPVKKK